MLGFNKFPVSPELFSVLYRYYRIVFLIVLCTYESRVLENVMIKVKKYVFREGNSSIYMFVSLLNTGLSQVKKSVETEGGNLINGVIFRELGCK